MCKYCKIFKNIFKYYEFNANCIKLIIASVKFCAIYELELKILLHKSI